MKLLSTQRKPWQLKKSIKGTATTKQEKLKSLNKRHLKFEFKLELEQQKSYIYIYIDRHIHTYTDTHIYTYT